MSLASLASQIQICTTYQILIILDYLGIPSSGDDPPPQDPPAPATAWTLDDDDKDKVDDSRNIESHVKLSKTPCKCLSTLSVYMSIILIAIHMQ